MTKKSKLDTFDAVAAERDKLQLAIHDMRCATKFPFQHNVYVDLARDIDGDYEGRYRVWISQRAMPYYMVEGLDRHSSIMSVTFYTESEIQDQRHNGDTFWRMLRHAAWKISRKMAVDAPVVDPSIEVTRDQHYQ